MSKHEDNLSAHHDTVKAYRVYVHRRRDNGEVFYVGYGTGDAPWKVTRKTDKWRSVADKVGFDVEVLYSGMSAKDADDMMRKLLVTYGSRWIVNERNKVKTVRKKPSKTRETYKDAFLDLVHHSGEEFVGTAFSFSRAYHIDYGAVLGLVKGYTDTLCGWTHNGREK